MGISSIPKVDLRAVSLLLRSRANVHAIGGVMAESGACLKDGGNLKSRAVSVGPFFPRFAKLPSGK